MSIVLSHGYFISEDLGEQKIMKPYPPLGLLYISAWLKKHELKVNIIDSTFIDEQEWLRQIEMLKPDILCLYTNLITKPKLIKLLDFIKSNHPNIITIGGGPDVRYNAENYLNHGFDYIVVGEGEESLLELIEQLNSKQEISNIPGIQKLENGVVTLLTERSHFKDLKELPIPDRNAIDLEKYLDVWEKHHGIRMANVSTQRGCPYTCKWCSTAVYGQSYRRRPASQVADEIEMLKKEFDVNGIWFVDDVFTVNHRWLGQLHTEFKNRELKIAFEIITRAERLNSEVLSQLKEMGCFRVWIGAESGSQKIIDAMDRRVKVETVRKMIHETQKHGMEAGTFIMVGYPGEGLKEIQETVDHLKTATPDQLTATLAYPIKGTDLYEEVKNDILNIEDWSSQTDRQLKFSRKYSEFFYKIALKYIWNSYHSFSNLGIQKIKYWLKAKVFRILLSIQR